MNTPIEQWTRETFLEEVEEANLSIQKHFLEWAARHGELRFGKGKTEATWGLWLTNSDGSEFSPFLVYANSSVSVGYKNMPEHMPNSIQSWYAKAVSHADGIVTEEAIQKNWFFLDLSNGGNALMLINCTELMQTELSGKKI